VSQPFLSPLNFVQSATDPATATVGDVYFNTILGELKVYNGTTWTPVGAGGGVTVSGTQPTGATITSGSLWFNSNTGQTFVYYSNYWLEIGAGSGSGTSGGTDPATAIAYGFLTMGA